MSAANGFTGTNSPTPGEAFAEAARAQRAGRLDLAVAAYRRALALKPDLVEAHHNLGLVLRAQGRLNEAAQAFRGALALRPSLVEAHISLALTLEAQGDLAGAAASLERALALRP